MTILFFARRFYPLIGGVEKHVLEISKRLVKKGHRVIVITEYEKNTKESDYHSSTPSATIEGIKILRINAGKDGAMKKLRIWLRLLKHIGVIKSADIVHCHDVFFWYLPFRFLFPFKKVYTTFHGYEGNNIPTRKSILMHKLSEKLSYGNVCVGDYLKKWYGTKPTFVTYGAVDIDLINQQNENPKSKIIFIGRLEEEAGIMKYLKVLASLKDRGINLSMDVFGEGSQEKDAFLFSQKKKLSVKFMGTIKSTESVLKNYEYVFCSRYLGVLESMAAKRPIFVEYNNEIKKDCFKLAPFRNYIYLESKIENICNAFASVVKNSKISEEKVNGAYNWVSYQTWDKLVEKYIKLWNS